MIPTSSVCHVDQNENVFIEDTMMYVCIELGKKLRFAVVTLINRSELFAPKKITLLRICHIRCEIVK